MNIKELQCAVEKYGLIDGARAVLGNRAKLSIPFSTATCELPIEELSLSVRGYNALKRNDFHTVGDVIDAIRENQLTSLRNLGEKTAREIKRNVVSTGYDRLSADEKQNLLQTMLETADRR